jgi:two-component system, cell cycle response regulator DivK
MENTGLLEKKAGNEQILLSGKTILIAEDIDLNYLYLFELLKSTGAYIVRAENGQIALDYCKNNHVDFVLMDLMMPVMNGYEATRQIKALHHNLPIIAQTAYTQTEDRKRALEAGCNDFIPKPIEKEELLEKIAKHVIYS